MRKFFKDYMENLWEAFSVILVIAAFIGTLVAIVVLFLLAFGMFRTGHPIYGILAIIGEIMIMVGIQTLLDEDRIRK